ncbi:hypothetical protein [Neptuniibacter halophilus]|uniref:hypothetical protein n=1 Tax=Neptuniibacter halophilus TaxID=651666 RepID=UPI0025728A5E|nr:hypothetical protein [Neptuniibacter halophilus]
MGSKKLILTLPTELSDLENAAVDLYNTAPRFSKSRKVLDLIEGGMILKEMGLLEYVVGLRSAKEMIGAKESDQLHALKHKVYTTLDGAAALQRSDSAVQQKVSSAQNVATESPLPPSETPQAPAHESPQIPQEVRKEETRDEPEKTIPKLKRNIGEGGKRPSAGFAGMMQIQTGQTHE